MPQTFQALRWTERVDAAMGDIVLLADHLSSAARALGRHPPAGLGIDHRDDLGDDVAGPPHHPGGADVLALLVDLVLVAHRHIAHRHAADAQRPLEAYG